MSFQNFPAKSSAWEVRSLPYAEAAKDIAEDVFGVGGADDTAEGVERGAEFDGGEFGGGVGFD